MAAGVTASALVFVLIHIPADLGGIDTTLSLPTIFLSLGAFAIGRFFFGLVALSTVYCLTANLFIAFFTHATYDVFLFFFASSGSSALLYHLLCIGVPYAMIFVLYWKKGPTPAMKRMFHRISRAS